MVVIFPIFKGSQLVASEIIRRTNMSARVEAIIKWTAVANIVHCLRNYNGTLQICAAFTNSSVYRLKKTWEKVPKTVSSVFALSTPQRIGSILTAGRFEFADKRNHQEIATDRVFRRPIPESA